MNLSEILVILCVALIVIKPQQLPQVAYGIGEFFKLIQKLYSHLRNEMKTLIHKIDEGNEHEKKS